jgi:chromodomain-helicase-DNA-binding protein 7
MKEDVEKSIPPKEETIVEVELTSLQKQYYRAVLEQNRGFLNRGCVGHNVPHLLNVAIQLRKVNCCLIGVVESACHSVDLPC